MTSQIRLWVGGALLAALLAPCFPALAQDSGFNERGNTLIADQFNNRVIEVDRHGNIVWQFGLGPRTSPRPPSSAPMTPSVLATSR